MLRLHYFACWLAVLLPALARPAAAATADYAAVEAVFLQHCLDCHAAQDPEANLVLESFTTLMKGGESGASLVPGKSADSLLVKLIEGTYEKDGKKKIMPPGKRKKLQPDEIAAIKNWIDAGAPAPKEPSRPVLRELVTPKVRPTVPPRRAIQALAYSESAKLVAVARHGEVELRHVETRALVRTLTGHRGAVNAVALSRDGQTLVSAAGEPALFGEARLWNVADGALLRTVEGHRDALYSVALSPDGKVLATGSYDQKIKLWDTAAGRELHTLAAHNGAIFDLAFRPDGKILASASGDRTVKLWEVATGKRVDTLAQSLKELYAVAWSPDGQRLAAGGVDNRIRIWQIAEQPSETTDPLLQARFAHEGPILNLLYSADGQTLLSSAEDRTVKLWKAGAVTERLVLETQPDLPPALAFASGDKTVVVGRLDGTMEFYDATSGKVVPPPAPELTAAAPRGWQRGTTAKIKLSGKNLASLTHLAFSQPKLSGELLRETEEKSDEAWIKITAAPDLARGSYELTLSGSGGSAKLKLHLDDLPQIYETKPDEATSGTARALPASFWGALEKAGDSDQFQFEAKAGEMLVFDLAVKSLGSKMASPLVTLLDARGAVRASAGGFDGADQFLAFKIPATGPYTARVADQMLGASKDHFYRLSVGTLPFVTGIFPLGAGTNTEAKVQLFGVNLPLNATVRVKTTGAGEVDVAIDPEKFRARRAFKLLVSDGPELAEVEPNDQPAQATPIMIPGAVSGRLWQPGADDADLFRFEAKSGQTWVIETQAAQRGWPTDTKIEILQINGQPVARLLLQAVRNSAVTFRGIDSSTADCRVENWEEMELNEWLYLQGEVVKIFRMPQGPDSGFQFYTAQGKRRAYFDTSATAHALDAPCYIVEPQPLGARLPANGLPVFTLNYANDDDGERQLGSDSRLRFAVPADGGYLVRVSESRGLGGEDFAYRLVVRAAKPDFKVTLNGANPVVNAGSGQSFSVNAERLDGFDGAIKVELAGLPPGFTASTPLVIEAGHSEAKGTLYARLDAPPPDKTNATASTVMATALVNGQSVTRAANNFGTIKLAGQPKLFVALEPEGASTPTNSPASADGPPLELTLAPGQSIPATLRIQRHGHEDLVTFFVENLPHGVIVDNIGLSGVLIPKGENERRIFLNAAKWVPETDRLCHAIENQAGKQTSRPVLLRVRAPMTKQAASAK